MFDNVFTNKLIAFIITPVVTSFAGGFALAIVLWLEKVSGADLDDAQITALAISAAVTASGAAATACVKYLHELGIWQKLQQFGAVDVNLVKEKDLAGVDLSPDDPANLPPDQGNLGAASNAR